VPPAGIVGVLQAAINGQVLVPQGVATRLAWNTADEATDQAAAELPLDETELHILARIARGHTDRRIATALRVSERTVRRRLRMLFSKLGVETRVQAGIYAAQRGLAGPEAGTLFLVNAAGADGDTARGAGA
jgi:DNA-binding NarL/FixJ family response regulator